MRNIHKVKLYLSEYVPINGEYKHAEVSRTFIFKDWDDVQNFIGYLSFGADGKVKFEIETLEEEKES